MFFKVCNIRDCEGNEFYVILGFRVRIFYYCDIRLIGFLIRVNS